MSAQPSAIRKIGKNTASLVAASVFKMLLSFGFTVVVARTMGVESFGKYALVEHYFELCVSLCSTALGILIARQIARAPNEAGRYVAASTVLVLLLTTVGCAALVGAAAQFGYAADTTHAVYIVGVALFPAALAAMLEFVFVGLETTIFVTWGTMIESLVRVGLGLTLLALGYGLLALCVSLAISRCCSLGFYVAVLRRRMSGQRVRCSWREIRSVVKEWRVFALENWASNIYNSVGVIALSIVWGERAVGPYAAAQKTLRAATVISQSYTKAIFPHLSRLFLETPAVARRFSQASLTYMMTVILPFAVMTAVLADWIVVVLFGSSYQEAVPLLRVLVWVVLLSSFNPFLSHVLFAKGEQHRSLQIAGLKLVVFGGLVLWLVPAWGAVGLAWASLVGAVLAFTLYLAWAIPGRAAAETLLTMLKPLAAGAALAVFLVSLRNIGSVTLLFAGGLLYGVLVMLLGVSPPTSLQPERSE